MRMDVTGSQHTPPEPCPASLPVMSGHRGKRRLARHAAEKAMRRLRRQGVNDRGTVLLMVLGVLALLAIIAVAYAAIGTADRATSAAAVTQSRDDDQSRKIADYLAQIVAEDVNSVYPQQDLAATNNSTFRRELFDAPGVDPSMVSYDPRATAQERGAGQYRFNPAGSITEPWHALAGQAAARTSRDPRRSSDPYLAATEPTNLRLGRPHQLQVGSGPDEVHLDATDWSAISNFAPSGNFVNLVNLRNNFKALPGFSETANPATKARMSDWLSRFDDQGQLERLVDNRRYHPAEFTNDQFFAFRPMFDTRPPEDPDHVGNQWADTDGDGFADARWTELTDVIFDIPRTYDDANSVVARDGRLRYFVAARCMDLTGLINVNTAGDFALEPPQFSGTGVPPVKPLAGFSPADIDLFRILRMTDVPATLGGANESYTALTQPSANSSGDYRAYDINAAISVGTSSYASLWNMRVRGGTPGQAAVFTGADASLIAQNSAAKWSWFDTVGYSSELPYASGGAQRSSSGIFGLGDELDLRTFNGVNDSSTTSTLEQVIDGRAAATPTLGSLRSNRPRPLEMADRDYRVRVGQFPAGLDPRTEVPTYGAALLQTQMDVRRLLTTINGARPLYDRPEVLNITGLPSISESVQADGASIVSNSWRQVGADQNVPQTVTGDGGASYANSLNDRNEKVRNLFRQYADCLMPYTDQTRFPNAWAAPGNTGYNEARGLSYGGSAELAYIMAAHMALNLRDALDREVRTINIPAASIGGDSYPLSTDTIQDDCQPTAVSLDMTQGAINATPAAEYPFAQLNLDPANNASPTASSRLPNDPNKIVSVAPSGSIGGEKKLNVFGIEPQPFISQVTSMAIWTDAPPSFGGDTERSTQAAPGQQPIVEPITIDVGVDIANSDFICEVLAVQLTNPFDTDIVLESKLPNGESFYYLEYAGRYYRLTPQDPDSPNGLKVIPGQIGQGGAATGLNREDRVLRAGQSRVFFATYPPTAKDVEKRFNDMRRAFESAFPGGPTGPGGPGGNQFKLEEFADYQFGDDHCHMPLIDPGTGFPVRNGTGAGAAFVLADIHAKNDVVTYPSNTVAADLVPGGGLMSGSDPERHVVNLWRVMRTPPNSGLSGGDAYIIGGATQGRNDLSNDYLVDRLRDPKGWTPVAGQPLPSFSGPGTLAEAHIKQNASGTGTNIEVDGTDAGDGGFGSAASAKDNTGFTLASFARVSRLTEGSSGTALPKGAIPPWCMETKDDNFYTTFQTANVSGTFSLNGVADNRKSQSSGLGNRGTFANSEDSHYATFEQFISETTGQNTSSLASFIDAELSKPVQAMPTRKNGNSFETLDTQRGVTGANRPFRSFLESAVEVRRLGAIADPVSGAVTSRTGETLFTRSGDFLFPLAVGPTHDPARLPMTTGAGNNRMQALEANWVTLSEALAMASDYYNPPTTSLYHNFARDERVLTNPGPVDPANPIPARADRGQLVLDAWAPYLEITGNGFYDPPTPGSPTSGDVPLGNGIPLALNIMDRFRIAGVPADEANFANLGRTVAYGSATKAVPGRINLNTAPLAVLRSIPLLCPDPTGWIAIATDLATNSSNTPVALWEPAMPGNTWDIATTIAAYRDKLTLLTRNVGAPIEVSFRDDRNGIATTPPGLSGREDATLVRGIRTAPGIKSLGEVMLADIAKSSDPTIGQTRDTSNSITALGFDNKAIGSVNGTVVRNGIDSGGYKGSGATEVPNGLADEYGEKIAIANALMNTTTVRSDVFCIWFLIHGYSPESVLVEDGRPMVPTFERRYMMILDRSNVQSVGDKPRVVMLKELPLR